MKDLIHILFAGVVLGTVMVVDWFTGMAGASTTGKLSSRVGVIGIIKKICYLALVVVGGVIDYLIASALVSIGISLQINYCFGMIITVWLIINELISILENLGEMGVPLPPFLTSTIKTLKSKVEEQGKHYQKDKDSEE